MAKLDIERLGGFAGYGGPGSHLRSRGTLDSSQLSAADRKTLELLFEHPPGKSGALPDGFIYRLTRDTPGGVRTIEVPEQHVPDSIKSVVKDEIV